MSNSVDGEPVTRVVSTLCRLCDAATTSALASRSAACRFASMPIACEPTSTLSLRSVRPPTAASSATTFSEAHLAARAWFLERADGAGLETRVDGAANHSAVLPARDPAARTLLLGSHLDSVERRRPLRRCSRRRLRARGASGRAGRRPRAAGHARGDRLHRRGGHADRHARQPGARGPADRARPRCTARRPRDPRRRARAPGAHERGDPRRAPRPGLARRLPRAAHRAGPGARAGRHRHRDRHRHRRRGVVHGRVRGRGAPRRDDADGRPARCGGRRGRLRGRRHGSSSSATSPELRRHRRRHPDRARVVQRRARDAPRFGSSAARSTPDELDALERSLTGARASDGRRRTALDVDDRACRPRRAGARPPRPFACASRPPPPTSA